MKVALDTAAAPRAVAKTPVESYRSGSVPKILFLIRALDTGGAQRQLVELANGLARSGWQVCVVTFYGGGSLAPLLEAGRVGTYSLDKGSRWDVLRFGWRLLKTLRREQPDIVHGYLTASNILLVLLRPLLGRVRVVWGVRASNMDLTRYDWLARLEFRIGALLSHFADRIICNSHAGRTYHAAQGYCPERMTVIPNGIDSRRFRSDVEVRGEVRAEWDIAPGERLIGLVGRLDPMKGHEVFLEAAAQVAAIRPEVRFVCVGDGPAAYRAQLMACAKRLGLRVIWAGEVTQVHRVYNAFDLLVCPSLTEGISNVVAEAMASGVPCVVTDVGDSARLVGETGWVCAPNDPGALACAIIRAVTTLPREPGPIRARIVGSFSTETLVKRTVEELSALLELCSRAAGPATRRQGADHDG